MDFRFIGLQTIYGVDGEHRTPYLTRAWIGRLRLHIFHRGDADPDHHDHPWDFWTFPLTSYVEEVVDHDIAALARSGGFVPAIKPDAPVISRRVVPALRWSHRPATYCHRVIGRYSGVLRGKATGDEYAFQIATPQGLDLLEPLADDRKIITVVWRGRGGRRWGFLKLRDGRFCWVHWKEYVFGGGKHAPCDHNKEDV